MSFSFFRYDGIAQALISNDPERFVIDPLNVTGDIVLQLFFDDVANQISAEVSLDGGSTFLSPFGARSANLLGPTSFFLFGDPATIPEPGTGLLVLTGLAILSARRKPRA